MSTLSKNIIDFLHALHNQGYAYNLERFQHEAAFVKKRNEKYRKQQLMHSDATAGINSNQKITKNGQKSPKNAIFRPKNSIFDLKTQKPPKTPSEASK